MKVNRTIDRAFKMLELLRQNPNGLNLNQITKEMEIPKTSTFDIIQTLLELGIIDKPDDELKKYTIGLGLFELGNSYLSNKSINNISDRYLKELSETLNMTSFMGVLNGVQVVYIKKYEPEVNVKTSCVVGSRADIHSTSLGKAMLAFKSKYVIKGILEHIEYTEYTSNTLRSDKDLLEDLRQTKERGFAIDNNENEEGIFCIGAPVYDHTNQVVASISVSGLSNKRRNIAVESEKVIETAYKISRELGYMGVM